MNKKINTQVKKNMKEKVVTTEVDAELEKKVEELLSRGTVEVVDRAHLKNRLLSGETLRVKFGIDPTGPNIHIGRGSSIKKLREFQDLGHQIVLIIGNATAQIGDASDKDSTRRMLSAAEVAANEAKYLEQIGRIIDLDRTEIHHNSEWTDLLTPRQFIELASLFTLQQITERDNFAKRLKSGTPVGLHESLYCLLQGFDSVSIHADVEIGGTDQLFNLLAGRKLQEHFGQNPQDVMTLQLLAGTDGRKMSTSWGNFILIIDSPVDKYGKIMRIADQLIPVYLECATLMPMDRVREISAKLERGEGNPMDYKKELAYELVRFYDGEAAAVEAQKHFESVVQNQELPVEIMTIGTQPQISISELFNVLKRTNQVRSKTEARTLLEQGGLRIGDQILSSEDNGLVIDVPNNPDGVIVRIGKRRFLRLVRDK